MSITAALDSNTAARSRISGRVQSSIRGILSDPATDWFDLSGSWGRTSLMAEAVNAGVRQEASLAQSSMGRLYGEMGITPTEPSLAINSSLRAGVSTEVAYRRVGADMRRHLLSGAPHSVALDWTMQRVEEMVTDDLNLAMREQSRRYLMANKRHNRGYRRVIRPELSTTGVCGLCIVASDRLYQVEDLMPIHSRCRCGVAPVTRNYDPADQNQVDLEAMYAAAGSTRAEDLIRVRVKDENHGELGPRIIPADSPGTAPPRSRSASPSPSSRMSQSDMDYLVRQIQIQDASIQSLEARIAAGVDDPFTSRALSRARSIRDRRAEELAAAR